MVLTSRTQTMLFSNSAASGALVRLPLSVVPHYETRCHVTGAIIPAANKPLMRPNLWSSEEHERFLHGLELFPNGPWKEVAKIVGTKSTRQTMTHAQKYRQKIERRMQPKDKPTTSVKKISRKKSVVAIAAHDNAIVTQTSSESGDSCMSFVDELLACNPMSANAPVSAVASPTEVYTHEFDTSFLDLEFDALLASFEAPGCAGDWSVFA